MMKLVMVERQSGFVFAPRADEPGVEVWRDPQGVICAYAQIRSASYWIHWIGLASFCYEQGTDQIKAYAHPAARRELILDVYRRTVLPLALQVCGTEVLHASAILTARGVVAFCAPSGTGKSTLAGGLSQRGYPLWADDAVALNITETEINAIALPFSLRLLPDAAAHFKCQRRTPPPARRTPTAPLAALVVLERSIAPDEPMECAGAQLPPVKAFAEILPHACCFSLSQTKHKERLVKHYLALSARAPVFKLRFRAAFNRFDALLDYVEELL
jgi:hypothetical protein